ncbi:MAG TPA: hypothetical protein VG650_15455 [Mycobacteriales bacterium]|nr:hypothetical protein [Mycobacteriales bacterium]
MRSIRRAGVALAAAAAAVGPASVALGMPIARPGLAASHAPKSVSARITTAAWFQPDPLCATPLGCGAIPLPALSPYPKGTFHIGTALGRQTARAFIGVKLSPRAQAARGGTLSIPLDTAPADGSVAPETASINVCVIYQQLTEVEGAFDGAPSPNCLPAARAKYVAKPKPHLLANLARLGGKLAAVKGFALLPAEATPTSAWQVVFKLPGTPGPASPRLSLLVGKRAVAPPVKRRHPVVHQHRSANADQGPVALPPAVPGGAAQGAPSNPVPVIAPLRSAGHYVTVGYQYPEVWLLPLVLAVLVPFTIRVMTKDLTRS